MRIPALIAGGGIGGLATALALARRGRPAHVLEKAPQFAEIGAGLQLAPNATRMLHALEILDDVLRAAVRPAQPGDARRPCPATRSPHSTCGPHAPAGGRGRQSELLIGR